MDGKIKSIEEKHRYTFKHNLKTEGGYSGSPIINKEDKSIIGIHMEKYDKKKSEGNGICLNEIYNNMKGNEPIKLNENNYNHQKTILYPNKINKITLLICILIIMLVVLAITLIIVLYILFKDKNYDEYFHYYFNEDEKDYEHNNYYNNSTKINETGTYQICVYGAEANPGGKGGMVCAHPVHFEINDIIKYRLGGREAGGKRGENCGENKGKGYNGAGMALAKFNNIILIAGGGGGNSESDNEGGDAEKNGDGYFKGQGAYENEYGKKGDEYAEDGSCNKEEGGKGGKGGGEIKKAGKWCGGGGGDGFCGGGGGGWGDPKNAGGGGGGSNFCSYSDKKKCFIGVNKKSKYSGIEIYIWK